MFDEEMDKRKGVLLFVLLFIVHCGVQMLERMRYLEEEKISKS